MPTSHRGLNPVVIVVVATLMAGGADADSVVGKQADAGRSAAVMPAHPVAPLFKGQPGNQKTELFYDPATRSVTVKVQVEDPRGNFIPNIRPANFAIYEDGVRQTPASVTVEHLPVTVGVLTEFGGRYPSLNEALADAVSRVAGQLTDEMGDADRVALWRYADQLEELAGFSDDREKFRREVAKLTRPPFSELNFYDGLIAGLQRMNAESGRRALIVISSGLDTFSQADFNDVLAAVRASAMPVYVIDISRIVRAPRVTAGTIGNYPASRWRRAHEELAELARISAGRLYAPESIYDAAAIFDDLLETLRVRYVVRYVSSNDTDVSRARELRIELVDPATDRPLAIVDSAGRPVRHRISVHETFVPVTTPVKDPEPRQSEHG